MVFCSFVLYVERARSASCARERNRSRRYFVSGFRSLRERRLVKRRLPRERRCAQVVAEVELRAPLKVHLWMLRQGDAGSWRLRHLLEQGVTTPRPCVSVLRLLELRRTPQVAMHPQLRWVDAVCRRVWFARIVWGLCEALARIDRRSRRRM